jgi:hypothetical protein
MNLCEPVHSQQIHGVNADSCAAIVRRSLKAGGIGFWRLYTHDADESGAGCLPNGQSV